MEYVTTYELTQNSVAINPEIKCRNCKNFFRNSENSHYGACSALKIREVFEEKDIDLQDADIVDYITFEGEGCSYSYVSKNFGCIRFSNETADE